MEIRLQKLERTSEAAAAAPKRSYHDNDISGQVAFVTGATAGIGEACAWQLAERGCNLIVSGRREARLETLKVQIEAKFPNIKVHALKLDMLNLDDIAALPTTLPESFRDVDILVNNAGLALGVVSFE